MNIDLIVKSPFGKYEVGERIRNDDEVKKILASENAAHVVKVKGGGDPKPKATQDQPATGDSK